MGKTKAQILEGAEKRAAAETAGGGGVVLPYGEGGRRLVGRLDSLRAISIEQARVYRMVWAGTLPLEDATRHCYMLGQIALAIKAGNEVGELEAKLAKTAFRGAILVGPGAQVNIGDGGNGVDTDARGSSRKQGTAQD